MESETSYTSSSGGGSGSAKSHTLSIGAYVSFEHEFTAPITGTKLGSIETEASYQHGWTWETASTSTLEQSISYSTSAGSDAVAFYSIPVETYVYKSLVPVIDAQGNVTGYDEQSMSVNIPHTAAVKVLPLETYERIAADYSELPQISGGILKHTVGDPATYPSSTYGYKNPIVYEGDWSGVNYGLGSITQEISMTEETEESFTHTNTVEAKVGGGPGNWVFGVTAGYEHGSNQVTISTSGSSFTGTICNMPVEAEPYNYYYAWKIFSYDYTLGDTSFPVVNYLVTDVTAPPKLPKDFQQDIDGTTSDQITLGWSYSGAAAGFQIYRFYEFPDGSGSYELAFVPASEAVDADTGSGTRYYKYVDAGLDPYAEYDYQIQVVGAAVPPESILSRVHTFRTKTDVGYPDICLHGATNGKLLVYPDTNSTVNVVINNMGDYTQTPRYQWQKLTEAGWSDITGALDSSYTFRSAGLADEGLYRCRVNAIYQDYYISDYSDVFTLEYSKRTPMVVDDSFKVTDVVSAGGDTVPKIEIALESAHTNHNYMPSGNVVFEVVGSDYKKVFPVALDTTGSSGWAYASLTLDNPLPAGAYEITALYTGSRVYKSLLTEDAVPYMSGSGSGYVLTIDSTYTYGQDITPSLKELCKSEGPTTTTPITSGVSYKVFQYSWRYVWSWWGVTKERVETEVFEFISPSSVIAAKAGPFTLVAFIDGNEVASRDFIVDRKAITLGIEDLAGMAGEAGLSHPDSSILKIDSGELAFSDAIADLGLIVQAINSAGTIVEITPLTDPGAYEIVGTAGLVTGTKYDNYQISFTSGTYILTGPKYTVTGISKLLNDKTVGTIELITPENNDNENWSTMYSNGTGLVFLARPLNGYGVKGWNVTKDSGDVVTTAGSSAVLNYQMLSEAIIVTVEFQVTQSTLQYKATNSGSGTVECISNPVFLSGGVARNGAEFTFKAVPAAGYHFVEWQLTETGKSPSSPLGTPDADGSNSCTITMGNGNTTLYAVFARDSYELTLEGDLQASYWDDSDNSVITPDELVVVNSGAVIVGDKEVTVTSKPGFSVGVDSIWNQDGNPVTSGISEDNQSYTFTIQSDTIIAVNTEVEHFDVDLELTGPGGSVNSVEATVNGAMTGLDELCSLAGGSSLVFTPAPAYGFVFDYWLVNGVARAEKVLNITALSEELNIQAVFADNNAYSISVTHNSRGSLSYTLNGGSPQVMGSSGSISVFEGDSVVLTAIPETSFMVENWVVDNVVVQSYAKVQTFSDIRADIAVGVVFGAQSYSTVTYLAGEGGSISATSDGVAFASGSNSVGNGSTLVFNAEPEDGKMVAGWKLNGNDISNEFGAPFVDSSYTIPALSGSANVEVLFTEARYYTLAIGAENASVSPQFCPELTGGIRDGATAVFTVVPAAGFGVAAVSVSGDTISSFDRIEKDDNGRWICTVGSINSDLNVTVVAVPLHTITVTAVGGTVSGSGIYLHNEVITLVATAKPGFRFINWTEAGEEVCTETEYSFTVEADRTLAANFSVIPTPPPGPAPMPQPGSDLGSGLQDYIEDSYPGINVLTQGSGTINQGQVSDGITFDSSGGYLVFGLNWGGSTLKLSLYSPDGSLYSEVSGSTPPLTLVVADAVPGKWSYTVTALDVPHPEYQYSTLVGQVGVALQGSDRYQTAIAVSQAGWHEGADTVLLARGDSFPDSLTGVSLAYQLDAPILLTTSTTLNLDTKREIQRLGAKRVIILGGVGAISGDVENELKAMVDTVERFGGSNRYDTAALISQELAKGGDFTEAFIATGWDFPDALAAASYAAMRGVPILLTDSGSIPIATREALNNLGIRQTVVVGGPAVVSEEVLNQLPNPIRVAGSSRYETALALAERYLEEDTKNVYIATGLSFPDALAGSVLAAKRDSGILLLPGNQAKLPDIVTEFIQAGEIKTATVLGGTGAVSNDIRAKLIALLN